ncbi:hypothetical protein NDU88_005692 [Pleurodeles waltl]|uniref:Uncharacterized protein n=1 Tax=Pleurodeles waltl TaxID=8319 RepID=A0AAV7TW30_PLEWA|nr:hypothetical protein NDU88_005692 [Pleurodeles waltl]
MRIKSRTGSVGVADSPTATLNSDYSGIRLSQSERALKAPSDVALTLNLTASENCPDEQANNMASTDTKMLQLIYGTIRELQTETRAESRRAREATKQVTMDFYKLEDQYTRGPKTIEHNITREEKEALHSLSGANDIIIKEADKGGAIVLMNKDDYIKKLTNN